MANVRTLSVALKATTRAFTRPMKRAGQQVRAFGRSVAGIAGIGGLAGLTLALKRASSAAAEFELSMAKVGVLLQGQTKNLLPQMTRQVTNLSMSLGQDANVLAAGLFDIVSASIETGKAMDVLTVSARLAKSGFAETSKTADILTTIINAYGVSADRAASIADKLFEIQRLGKTDLTKVADNFGKVISTAAIAGLSFDELGAAFATMTAQGIASDEAVTSLNAILRQILKTTPQAAAAAAKFGLELSTAELRAIGLTGIVKKLAGASPEVIAAIAGESRGIKGLAALVSVAEKGLNNLNTVTEASGQVNTALAEVMQTTSAKIDVMAAKWEAMKRGIGETSFFRGAIDAVGNFFDGFVLKFKLGVLGVKIILTKFVAGVNRLIGDMLTIDPNSPLALITGSFNPGSSFTDIAKTLDKKAVSLGEEVFALLGDARRKREAAAAKQPSGPSPLLAPGGKPITAFFGNLVSGVANAVRKGIGQVQGVATKASDIGSIIQKRQGTLEGIGQLRAERAGLKPSFSTLTTGVRSVTGADPARINKLIEEHTKETAALMRKLIDEFRGDGAKGSLAL